MISNKKILIFVAILLGVPFLWLGYMMTTTIMENGVMPPKFAKTCYTVTEASKMREEYKKKNNGDENGFKMDLPECPPARISPSIIFESIF